MERSTKMTITAIVLAMVCSVVMVSSEQDDAEPSSIFAEYGVDEKYGGAVKLTLNESYGYMLIFDATITGGDLTRPLTIENKAFDANDPVTSVVLGRELADGDYSIKVKFKTFITDTITAGFKVGGSPEMYKLTVTAKNAEYTVDPDMSEYAAGTDITVKFTPASGLVLKSFTVNGKDASDKLVNDTYVFNILGNTIILAEYSEPAVYCKLSMTVGGANYDVTPRSSEYLSGTDITITFSPTDGYALDHFTVDGKDSSKELKDNVYTFTITHDTVIDALYTKETPSSGGVDLTIILAVVLVLVVVALIVVVILKRKSA